MNVIYALQDLPAYFTGEPILFLAGPTPRSSDVPSWRPEAIRILEELGYEGVVLVPEHENGTWPTDEVSYRDQCAWEHEGLDMANPIVFWIPRDLKTLPGFTTNVEFGLYCRSCKIVLGFPEGAPKTRYLEWIAEEENIPVFRTLRETLREAVGRCSD